MFSVKNERLESETKIKSYENSVKHIPKMLNLTKSMINQ